MTEEFKEFYDALKDNLDSYNGEYASFIDYGPSLYKLLSNLLMEEDLSREMKLNISAAIAYYVVPRDVIPEDVYGPYGYIDDIYLCVFVLNKLAKEYGYDMLQDSWDTDDNIKDILDECYDKSSSLLENNQKEEILKYVGLIE